ncbi:MAG: DUF4124 domain-containing protein [Candidatus Tectomicrobia bacterium]|uniref:DUF4124 domain-containing protein n=1 Tax=Tectimicrobiota bacterium TaxID=2528274 RepID=A0A932GQN8_UNCTE|nr:DUF4124 domain-containing protein [Candidatus Tectomicrobia bacterium]
MLHGTEKRRGNFRSLWGLTLFLVVILAPWAQAETIYRGVGPNGEIFFTDNPGQIPARSDAQIEIRFWTPQPAWIQGVTVSPAPSPNRIEPRKEFHKPFAPSFRIIPKPKPLLAQRPRFQSRELLFPESFLVPRQDRLDPNFVWIGRYRYDKGLFRFPHVSLREERELRERFGRKLGF